VPLYARAAGFPSTILHGFATLARAIEALNTHGATLGGDPASTRTIDARFTKPLVLPARVSVYTKPGLDRGIGVWVGDARAQEAAPPAYLEGVLTVS
jgi:acyl dehydratase